MFWLETEELRHCLTFWSCVTANTKQQTANNKIWHKVLAGFTFEEKALEVIQQGTQMMEISRKKKKKLLIHFLQTYLLSDLCLDYCVILLNQDPVQQIKKEFMHQLESIHVKLFTYLGLWQDGLPPLSLPQQTPLSLLQALLIHLHLSQDHLKAEKQMKKEEMDIKFLPFLFFLYYWDHIYAYWEKRWRKISQVSIQI